jgi:hypothetical protein
MAVAAAVAAVGAVAVTVELTRRSWQTDEIKQSTMFIKKSARIYDLSIGFGNNEGCIHTNPSPKTPGGG